MADIPLVDVKAQNESLREEIDAAMRSVIDRAAFINGPEIAAFESEFAAFCNAEHCIGVASGTDALTVGLQAAGVKPGDEVITTAMTFFATVESIVLSGATPVLVDVNPDTALFETEAVEAAITDKTAAVVAVHLYGQPVDLDGFRQLADRKKLLFAEDAAQGHGASWQGKTVGSVGDVAAFSFFPGKNLGAFGDAGGTTTNDAEIARRARAIKDHGRASKYTHDLLGTNARLDTLQAAILSVKLKKLAEWNETRRRYADLFDRAFADLEGVTPIKMDERAISARHLYVIKVSKRDEALEFLRERGIGAGIHYPVPMHRQPAIADRFDVDAFPHADELAESIVSLPLHPFLNDAEAERIIEAVTEFEKTHSGVVQI